MYFGNIVISMQDVIDILQHLNNSRAFGPDNITPTLLKLASTELSKPIAESFNFSLQQSSVPQKWRVASVTPSNIISNY